MLHRAHALPGLAALAVSWGAHVRLSAEFLFARAAATRCTCLSVGTLSSMVRLADKDDSGTISFEEFAEIVSAL